MYMMTKNGIVLQNFAHCAAGPSFNISIMILK